MRKERKERSIFESERRELRETREYRIRDFNSNVKNKRFLGQSMKGLIEYCKFSRASRANLFSYFDIQIQIDLSFLSFLRFLSFLNFLKTGMIRFSDSIHSNRPLVSLVSQISLVSTRQIWIQESSF